MAKLKMKRVEIVSSIEDSQDLFDFLQRKGVLELHEFEDVEGMSRLSVGATVSQLDKYLGITLATQKTLDKYAPEKKSLLRSLNGAEELSVENYEKRASDADGLLSECMKILSLSKKIDEYSAEIVRLTTLAEGLKPWLSLDVPMQYKGTEKTKAFIGSFQREMTLEQLLSEIAVADDSIETVSADIISSSSDLTCVFILCSNDEEKKTEAALRSIGFVRPPDPTRHVPSVRYGKYLDKIKEAEKNRDECKKKLGEYKDFHRKAEFAADYFTIRRDRYKGLSNIAIDDKLMAMSGYVPEVYCEKLKKQVEQKYTAAMEIYEPEEDEDVPVLLKNRRFGGAIESVTEMYSLPGKDDVDPNPVMAIFYYVFFGIMLSDAGYGLLMVIAMIIAKAKFKLTAKMKKTTDMFLYCGISTVFWGAMFGSWFGDIVKVVAVNFFGVAEESFPSLALWFEPVVDPMRMMLYSFLFGIIHLFAGLGVRFYMLWKSGKKLDAFCDVLPVYLLVTGVAPIGANVIDATIMPPIALTVGKYLALAGAVLVVLTSGRSSKNIFGKLFGGLYGLYNTGAGYLGDILSYSRLLALGLSTGVIATVINMLATMPSNKAVKLIMLIVVFPLGHGVNIAVNLIGTYVHTNRLQYVEFFSKFYEGGGRSFTPLKINTKYYSIKED
ncbi:MAG: V-type ATP synthase subunit I [Clostridiales bacterium]|nr:V-type ATP synthase subunit I [Clostridiales bacterium]